MELDPTLEVHALSKSLETRLNATDRKKWNDCPVPSFALQIYALQPDANEGVLELMEPYLFSLKDYLKDSELILIQTYYREAMAYLLASERNYDLRMTQPEVMTLAQSLAQVEPGSKIYLPQAFALPWIETLPQDVILCGYEYEPAKWAIQQMMLHALGRTADLRFGKPETSDEQYDYIFTFAGVGRFEMEREEAQRLEHLVNHQLSPKGKCVILTFRTLTTKNEPWNLFRAATVGNELLDTTCVFLPQGLMERTMVSVQLLMFSAGGSGQVRIVDAKACTKASPKRGFREQRQLDADAVLQLLAEEDGRNVYRGTADTLVHHHNLNPLFYLTLLPEQPLAADEVVLPINELVKVVRGKSKPISMEELPLVRFQNLTTNYHHCSVDIKNLERERIPSRHVIEQDCWLLGYRNGEVRIGRLKGASEANPVILGPGLCAFVPQEKGADLAALSKVKTKERDELLQHIERFRQEKVGDVGLSELYLLRQLLQPYVAQQLKRAVEEGRPIFLITQELLQHIFLVATLSPDEQQRLCNEDADALLSESERKLRANFETYRRDIRMKRHAIGHTVFDLQNWWKLLMNATETNGGKLELDTEISTRTHVTLANLFEHFNERLEQLSTQIDRLDIGAHWSLGSICLGEEIKEYVKKFCHPEVQIEWDDEIDDEEFPVVFSPEALQTVLDNIVHNAIQHGFEGHHVEHPRIVCEANYIGSEVLLTISNNGAPLSPDLLPNDVFLYGQTTGKSEKNYGLGAYEVDSIMQRFGGAVKLYSHPDKEFTVTYQLLFERAGEDLEDVDNLTPYLEQLRNEQSL